ncbi:MAG: Uma2 family endonuclease [Chloroflexota bacterium]|nr:Uma2 family endonuclease [Chloroflexota bacterium]
MVQKYEERLYSVEEYLALEAESLEKHEYYRGQLYQMSGGSPEHALIASNTIIALGLALRDKSCQVYSGDVLIKVDTRSHYTYADASVVCGRPAYEQIKNNRMLTNPALIVEVLSPSTQNYGRGTKFQLYKALTSFQDYLLIDSREIYVQHYRKLDSNTWQEKTYQVLEQIIPLENLNLHLTLEDLYRNVEFEPEPEISN